MPGPIIRGRLIIEAGPAAGHAMALELAKGHHIGIGKDRHNELVIEDDLVSRRHATLRNEGGRLILEDLGSTNGTYLNGTSIRRCAVESGDLVRIGPRSALRFVAASRSADANTTQPRPAMNAPPARPSMGAEEPSEPPEDATVLRHASASDRHFLVGALPGGHKTAHEIIGRTMIVGRDPRADLCLPVSSVSKRHARLQRSAIGVVLEDLKSTNGTFVNGEAITHCVLADGDVVTFDAYPFVYRQLAEGQTEAALLGQEQGWRRYLVVAGAAFVGLVLLATAFSVVSRQGADLTVKRGPVRTRYTAQRAQLWLDYARGHAERGLAAHQNGDELTTYEELTGAWQCLQRAPIADNLKSWAVIGSVLPEELRRGDLEAVYQGARRAVEALSPAEIRALQEERFGSPEDNRPHVPEGAAQVIEVPRRPLEGAERRRFLRTTLARLSAEFGEAGTPPAKGFLDRVDREIRRLTRAAGRRDLLRALERARTYLPMVRRVLAARKVPESLAFVAFVESGFNPRARSRAGAVGLWQLMPSTAREYGLRVDRHVDQRLDPLKSTEAARELLLDHVSIFGSRSFLLALAAYNAGDGKVRWALKQLDDPFARRSFWALAERNLLPPETLDYVPRVLAAAVLATAPAAFGVDGVDPLTQVRAPAYDRIDLRQAVSLPLLSEVAVLSLEALRQLNPAIPVDRFTTPEGRPFVLNLPYGTGQAVVQALGELDIRAGRPAEDAS